MKRSSLGIMAASVLAMGVAHAQIGMQIETERDRRKKAFLDNECAATGQTCVMGPHGPNGAIQCQYCGREPLPTEDPNNPAVIFSQLSGLPVNEQAAAYAAQPVALRDLGDDTPPVFVEGKHQGGYSLSANRPIGKSPALALPFDESHQIKGQGDPYESHGLKSGRMLTGADLGPMNSPKGPAAPGPDEPLPDRFSVNPESPFYDERWASVRIGVRFDGSDRPGDVEEYCVSEGWIRVQMFMNNGKPKRERGKIVCLKRHGRVEPYRK